jgi:hypothetical protein
MIMPPGEDPALAGAGSRDFAGATSPGCDTGSTVTGSLDRALALLDQSKALAERAAMELSAAPGAAGSLSLLWRRQRWRLGIAFGHMAEADLNLRKVLRQLKDPAAAEPELRYAPPGRFSGAEERATTARSRDEDGHASELASSLKPVSEAATGLLVLTILAMGIAAVLDIWALTEAAGLLAAASAILCLVWLQRRMRRAMRPAEMEVEDQPERQRPA